MAFKVNIYFTGLIAYVFNPAKTKVRVLLLNARNGMRMDASGKMIMANEPAGGSHGKAIKTGEKTGIPASPSGGEVMVPPHDPWLVFDPEDMVQPGNKKKDRWRLENVEISFGLPGHGLSVIQGRRNGNSHLIPSSNTEAEDLSWTAEMQKIVPQAAALDRRVLAASPDQRITASLTLQDGILGSYQMCLYDNEIWPFAFQAGEGQQPVDGYIQALSDVLRAEIDVPGDALVVEAHKYRSGEVVESMRLRPQTPGGHVDLLVGNLGPVLKEGEKQERMVAHFLMYYMLCKDQRLPHRPIPYTYGNTGAPPIRDLVIVPSIFDRIAGDPTHGGIYRPICNGLTTTMDGI